MRHRTYRTILASAALVLLVSTAQAQTHLWSQHFGGDSNDTGYSVAVDGAGNVYMTGGFVGTVNFGGGDLVSSGGSGDMFLAKYDASGAHLWSQRFGSTNADIGSSVAVDPAGNVYVTGYFFGTVDFGGGDLVGVGSFDIVLAKYNATGAHQWSKSFGSTNDDRGYSVAVDGAGNVYMTGYFWDTVNFGGGNLPSAGVKDIFLAKFDASGAHLWSKRFGSTGDDEGRMVATDESGNVCATGAFSNTVDFGGGGLASVDSWDIFLASYNAGGDHQWSRGFGSTDADRGYSVSRDGAGNVYMTGYFRDTVNFGGDDLVSAGDADIFLAKYDNSGTHQWSQRFGGLDYDIGYSVAADSVGSVFVTGSFERRVDFGGGNLVSTGLDDIFLAKYDASGVHLWSQRFGHFDSDIGYSVAADGAGNVYATGYFSGTVNFGGGYLTADFRDIFLAKFGQPPVSVTVQRPASLEQNYPNPFNPTTTIAYTLREQSLAVVNIYDASGALVVRLDQGIQGPGTHRVVWNGRDTNARPVGSGVYFYRLEGTEVIESKKMVLLK